MALPFEAHTFLDLQKGNTPMNGLYRSLAQLSAASGVSQDHIFTDNAPDPISAGGEGEGGDTAAYNPGQGALSREMALAMYNKGYGGVSDQMTGPRDHQVFLDKTTGQRDLLNSYRTGKQTWWSGFAEHLPTMLMSHFAPVVGMIASYYQKEADKEHPTDANNPNSYIEKLRAMRTAGQQATEGSTTSAEHRTTMPVPQAPMIPNFQNNIMQQRMLMAMISSMVGKNRGSSGGSSDGSGSSGV